MKRRCFKLARWVLLGVGVVCLLASSLPWLGLAQFYRFRLAGYGVDLPRLEWIDSDAVYEALCVPMHQVARIPPLDEIIYIPRGGPRRVGYSRVDPFMLFLFYFLVGTLCVWLALRGRRAEREGHCPAFGYDLRGTPGTPGSGDGGGSACPECGAACPRSDS